MFRMVKTEIWKLKRYHMIWAGVFLMLLSVVLTLFSTTALDGTVWTFSFFTEQVIKNNATTIFPMCIALIAGYIIAREGKDDTLKSIMTIPVPYSSLLWGKLLVCALLSLFFGLVSAAFTVIANLMMGFPGISVTSVLQTFIQIILKLSVFVFCGHACNCICRPYTKRTYAWNNYCLCLWLWRYVCFWKCYISKYLSGYCKFRLDQLPKLRSGGTLECVNLSV